MRLIQTLLWGLIITMSNLPVLAWQVTLQSTDTPAQVIVSNDTQLHSVNVYLVWFDIDRANTQFVSLTFEQESAEWQWQSGLKPVFNTPTDLPAFDSYSIAFENQTCPETHRCFLGFVATLPDQEPTRSESWQASSFLPLSLSAGCERLPGQQFFLSCGGANRFYGEDIVISAGIPDDAGTSDTEKPDIFKQVDNKLLYANGQAKRFQVIDIADLSNPRLEGWTALTGNPRELYVLGDYYVLLQNNYMGEDGTLLTVLHNDSIVQEMTLPGWFIESRRRGEFIYSVTAGNINVLRLTDQGQLEEVDTAQLPGYSPTIAIFPNYLVIANHNPEENQWRSTQIQVFDLSQSDDPLVALPTLKVPGQVPSEFHLNVLGQQLRVVYGPADRADGSTLAIYDLTSPKMDLIGQVNKIAPGEDLFATRFIDNRAFVVTYERQDPLWVIDLSDPTQPKILGELEVPGWSEKMFFHEDRLFAVGIDDQPLENEQNRWVRRVTLSLFDVKEPTQPRLINRFTPLAGEVSYSWSLALKDERALLLNWEDAFAALPIESWETDTGSHLQIVSLENDKIEDAGRLDISVPIQRTLSIAPNVLAALGDQALLTLRRDTGELLGGLELATNLTWLKLQDDKLWAAARGNKGYHRFYQYTKENVETPAQRWSLPRGYAGLEMDRNLAVFYNYNPLAVQVLDVKTGTLKPVQVLEEQQTDTSIAEETIWYDRSQPLMHEGWFYVAEQRPFKPAQMQDYWQIQWMLRSWDLTVENAKEAPIRSIPGRPLAFTAKGDIITQEFTDKGQLRLNLLALETDNARLLHSRTLTCSGYSPVKWTDEIVYVNCNEGWEPSTQLLKLNPIEGFTEIGRWTLTGYQDLRAVSSEVVLMYSWNNLMRADQNGCNIYQLLPEKEPVLLKHLESCPYMKVELTPTQAWMAEGFAGIKEIKW